MTISPSDIGKKPIKMNILIEAGSSSNFMMNLVLVTRKHAVNIRDSILWKLVETAATNYLVNFFLINSAKNIQRRTKETL